MPATKDRGINYAGPFAPSTNRNPESGIRYGVINQQQVGQVWYDEAEADYGEPQEAECPHCSANVPVLDKTQWGGEFECPRCEKTFEVELPDFAEPLSFFVKQDDLEAECGEDGDIFIIKSLYFTYAQFCSPCAPGACYLMNWLEEANEDNKAYCFGHDWFEDGKAPYPVYSVATGQLVQPE
jgi:hypothetical protein